MSFTKISYKRMMGLSADQSRQLNSRIILLMANQIADNRKLTELITLARTSLDVA